MARVQDLPAELVEGILQHLPMLDLILMQRVSKHWRDITRVSPHLRRQTFLGYVPAGEVKDDCLSRFVCDNKPAVPSLYGSSVREGIAATASPQIFSPSKVRFNPVFPSEGDIIRTRTQQFRENPDSGKSWLEMYLTQPPCRFVEATVYYTKLRGFTTWARRGSDIAVCTVQIVRPWGVRARDVLETMKQLPVGSRKKWQRIDIRVPGVERV